MEKNMRCLSAALVFGVLACGAPSAAAEPATTDGTFEERVAAAVAALEGAIANLFSANPDASSADVTVLIGGAEQDLAANRATMCASLERVAAETTLEQVQLAISGYGCAVATAVGDVATGNGVAPSERGPVNLGVPVGGESSGGGGSPDYQG